MKKLLALILIVAMFMPVFATAEDPDPIVGFWYLVMDVSTFPEKIKEQLWSNIHTYRILAEVDILYFNEQGEIYAVELNYEPMMVHADDAIISGTWTKNDKGEYNVVYKSKSAPAYFDDGKLFIKYHDVYAALRKMEYPDMGH